jgi:hypothetical protein
MALLLELHRQKDRLTRLLFIKEKSDKMNISECVRGSSGGLFRRGISRL